MKTVITSPFEPVAELQSEDGVLSYLSKLSELSRTDFCIELCSIMSAKHNLMLIPAGLNEYAEKQKLATDLTDKATAICIIEFGQAAVFGFAGGNVSQLNELINNIGDTIAQQDLEPEQYGHALLLKLSEILRPVSENEGSWLEDLLSDDSGNISHEDYELLKESPFIVFILMAFADGEIDLKETTALAEIILNPEMFQNDFLVQLVRDAIPEVNANSIPDRLAPIMQSKPDYSQKLIDITNIIDSSLPNEDAKEFKKALIKFGYKIADASGGLFGLGSRVCKQEKQMLRKISSILGVSGV